MWPLMCLLLVPPLSTHAVVATQSDAVNAKAVEEIIAEIDKMPSWPLLPWKPTNAKGNMSNNRPPSWKILP